METPKQFANKLRLAVREIESSRPVECMRIANDLNARIKRRIINEGKNSKGQSTGKYSDAVVPAFFFKGKSRAGDPDRAYRAILKKHGWFASYKDLREVQGLQTNHKDYSYSGRMWQSVRPGIKKATKNEVEIEITATTNNDLDKLRWNSERDGDLMQPSKREIDLTRASNRERVRRKLQKAFA